LIGKIVNTWLKCLRSDMANRSGRNLREVSWHLNGVYIRLVQPEGTASITSQPYLDYDKLSRVTAVKEAAKDL
jgi:hypothetical protein